MFRCSIQFNEERRIGFWNRDHQPAGDPCSLCPSIAGEITLLDSKPRKGVSPVSLSSYGTSVDGKLCN